MTYKDERKKNVQKQEAALAAIQAICGIRYPDGKQLYRKLRRIEREIRADALRYNDGLITTKQWDDLAKDYLTEVSFLFRGNLEGLRLNSDSRGTSIQIDPDFMCAGGKYGDTGLFTNMGGYGIPGIEF